MQQRQDGDDTERLQQPTPHQQPKVLGVDQADQQAIRSQHQDAQSGQQQAFLVVGQRGLDPEEPTSELQSLMRSSYAVFRLKQKQQYYTHHNHIAFAIASTSILRTIITA